MNIAEAVTKRLNVLLKEKSVTRYTLEKKTGISRKTLKSIIKGKTKGVNLKTVVLIAYGLDMSVAEFLHDDLFDYNNLTID